MRRTTRAKRRVTVTIITLITLFIVTFTLCAKIDSTYTRDAVVGTQEEDITYFYDERGREWCATNCNVADGQEVVLEMNTNGTTDYIYDDIIVAVYPVDIVME